MTSDLTQDEIDTVTETVVNSFNVSSEDVTTDVSYVASGTLDLSIPKGSTEEEIVDAVTQSIAELLNVHPRDVTVTSVDLTSGEVQYEVSSDSYANSEAIQLALENLSNDSIEDKIQETLPSTQVTSNTVSDDIEVDVSVIVDGSDAGNIGQANRDVYDELSQQGYDVDSDVAIVTSAPTKFPTFTTAIPSPAPSITGIVVTLTLSRTGDVLTTKEVDALQANLANDYGVDVDDVIIEPEYIISGSIQVDSFPEELSDDELATILQQDIADALGVHSKDVTVSVDSESGEVSYTVTSSDDSEAEEIQRTLETNTFLTNLNNEIADSLPTSVLSVDADDDIVMNLVVTVDASESTVDLDEITDQVETDFVDQGFDADSDSNPFKILFGIIS